MIRHLEVFSLRWIKIPKHSLQIVFKESLFKNSRKIAQKARIVKKIITKKDKHQTDLFHVPVRTDPRVWSERFFSCVHSMGVENLYSGAPNDHLGEASLLFRLPSFFRRKSYRVPPMILKNFQNHRGYPITF